MSRSKITDFTREHRSETMAVIFIFITLAGLAILLVENDASRFNARCIRCSFCVNECPVGAISLDEHSFPVIDRSKCRAWDADRNEFVWDKCGLCLKGCPTRVIELLNNENLREKHTIK